MAPAYGHVALVAPRPYSTGGAYGKRGAVYYQDVYNNFYSTHGGLVVGVDTSLSDNIQLGLFGNYGNINHLLHRQRLLGGGGHGQLLGR